MADEVIEEGSQLTSADLNALEMDTVVRDSVKDPALRRALLAIDSSSDRAKALSHAAANDPRLREFLDNMLLAMGKARRGVGGGFEFMG